MAMDSDWSHEPGKAEAKDIENEPELAGFLNYLLAEALAHPEGLKDASEVWAGDEDLGVKGEQATADLIARSARLTEGVSED